MEHYSRVKKKKLSKHTTWMNIKNFMFNKRTLTQKKPHCIVLFGVLK